MDIWKLAVPPVALVGKEVTTVEVQPVPEPVDNSSKKAKTSKSRKNAKSEAALIASDALCPSSAIVVPPGARVGEQLQCLDDRCSLALRVELSTEYHILASAISPQGHLLVASSGAGTRMWRLVGGSDELERVLMPSAVRHELCHSFAFSADGSRLAASTAEGKIYLLDVSTDALEGGRAPRARSGSNTNTDEEDVDDDDEEDDSEESGKTRETGKGVLRAAVWHVFDHWSHVRERAEATNGASSSSSRRGRGVEGLSFVVSSLQFNADGCFLAVGDANKAIYVYDVDRCVCVSRPLFFQPAYWSFS